MSNSLQPHGLQSARLLCPRDSPGKNTRVGCQALLQGIFPTQGPNPGLLHCRQILYQLNHQRSTRILEWLPIPSPGNLPNPGIESGSPALQPDSLPAELPGKPAVLFSSVQFSHSVVSDSLGPHELQHARPPCPSPTPRVHPNSCPSSR